VISEIYRVLKPGGHFSISDIVMDGTLPQNIQKAAEMYVGCVSGAIQKNEYLNLIEKVGFKNVIVQKEKTISLPEDVLQKYLDPEELFLFRQSNVRILSVTVYAEKPGTTTSENNTEKKEKNCCGPECCN